MDEEERRKSEARRKIEGTVGVPFLPTGRDYLLPDGRRLLLCYSKPQHGGRGFYVGLPNRLQADDAIVLLLGESDLVFPKAEALLRYADSYRRSNDGRPISDFQARDGQLTLRVARLGLTLPVDDRIDAYGDLVASARPQPRPKPRRFGQPFQKADEGAATVAREPFTIDPDLVDRGTRGHALTRNALAVHLAACGIEPLDLGPDDPLFDLGWARDDVAFVAEVKSLTDANEERQLRLGLGQVLRYRHLLQSRLDPIVAVLAVEREPADPGWMELCDSLGVWLVWPIAFVELTSRSAT